MNVIFEVSSVESRLTAQHVLILIAVGLLAGLINGVVGSGSLITFPVLIALGLPPVVANGSNAAGMIPGGFTALFASRRELIDKEHQVRVFAIITFIAATFGALLVIIMPPAIFTAIVPWLIVFAVLLVAVQPLIIRRLSQSRKQTHGSNGLLASISITGIYSGYFGAAQGVMLLAVLGIFGDGDPRTSNGLKNLLTLIANFAATIIFAVTGHIYWVATIFMGIGTLLGGFVGGHTARRLPARVFRLLIIAVGAIAAVSLAIKA